MTDRIAPYGYHYGTKIPRKSPPANHYEGRGTCRHCGETELAWERYDERWVLCSVGGGKHVCPKESADG
jgi:hypothetical protein